MFFQTLFLLGSQVCEDRRPEPADPGSYGMLLDGTFRHPFATPVDEENPHACPGRLEEYELNSYVRGMKVEAVYEGAAYFVPKAYLKETPDYAYGNQTHGVYVEWDRSIIWAFTNHGIYALSAEKLLGKANLGAPKEPFRNSGL